MTTRNHRCRFLANNVAADSSATLAYSSYYTGFPGTNVIDEYRHNVWKTNGNFTIGSTNNRIYIDDGSAKTVVLASANYSGGAALALHIEAQLNASSSDWTCSYSATTYKFTIGHTGAATLRFSQTSSTVWDSLGYTGAADVVGTSWVADEQRNHTSEWVTFDLGVAQEVTAFCLISELGQVFPVSSDATIKIMGNNVATWSAPPVNETITITDSGAFEFLDDLSDTTYRYWKLEIIDRENTAGPESFVFSHLYLGDYETITSRNVARGFRRRWIDPCEMTESEGGVLYFRTRTKYRVIESVEIQHVDAADQRNLEQLVYDLGKSTPFYISIDPMLEASQDLGEMTMYCVFAMEPEFIHAKTDVYTMTGMVFREVI